MPKGASAFVSCSRCWPSQEGLLDISRFLRLTIESWKGPERRCVTDQKPLHPGCARNRKKKSNSRPHSLTPRVLHLHLNSLACPIGIVKSCAPAEGLHHKAGLSRLRLDISTQYQRPCLANFRMTQFWVDRYTDFFKLRSTYLDRMYLYTKYLCTSLRSKINWRFSV